MQILYSSAVNPDPSGLALPIELSGILHFSFDLLLARLPSDSPCRRSYRGQSITYKSIKRLYFAKKHGFVKPQIGKMCNYPSKKNLTLDKTSQIEYNFTLYQEKIIRADTFRDSEN